MPSALPAPPGEGEEGSWGVCGPGKEERGPGAAGG